ncbi:MAG: ROK family protein, partial [Erysipelotrichaceae bacterium]|nr:ROK family protein [Erysipelotrichaceae bacterium]
DSKITRGPHFTAGELSYVITQADEYDQRDVTLANSCSTRSLLENYATKTGGEKISGREFCERMPDDPLAQEALDELCLNIAIQIYNLAWILDLEKVAIGGGISRQPIVTEKIKEKFEVVKSNTAVGKLGFPLYAEIVPCTFSNDANLIGSFITYTLQ